MLKRPMARAETLADAELPAERYEAQARELAARFAGTEPTSIRRFTTGAGHYVYEAAFAEWAPVVVRITQPRYRVLCESAAALSKALRPLGVPLPELLVDGSSAALPYLLLERLPGTDLWEVLNGLSPQALAGVATRVADAQAVVAAIGTADRYGYAASPERAPLNTWAEVLEANLHRSRGRIKAAGLFDGDALATATQLVGAFRDRLNAVPATPFLHDTTTRNVIVAPDGRFSGIVDVDDLCFGDPRYVIALTHTAVRNQSGPIEYVDRWLYRAGYERDALFWLYVAVFVVDFMSEHGQQFNGNQRPSSEQQRQHLLALFKDAAERVRSGLPTSLSR